MKRFKDLTEELFTEGGEMYPADDMTMKELKIACYAAQNILDMIEDGAMIQRWQISSIVKASEELASVCTSMRADEEDWEDEYEDEEPMYVGYEYPSMYGEEVEQIDEVEGSAKRNRELHAAGRISKDEFNRRMGYGKYKKKGPAGVGPLGNSLYKNLVKSAVAKNEELEEGYNDPEYIRRAIPALKNAVEFHKDTMKDHDKKSIKGSAEYVRAHSAAANAHKEAAERHRIAHAQLSAGSKDVEYYVKPARELGAYAEKLSDKANRLKEELEEGYNDPIHRKYISDVVHEYVSKDDPKHEKIVDHLHQAKNFGNKTSDSLETNADISTGAARRITKAVADHLKANFGGSSKPQTQAQRIDAYLKQKHIGLRSK